MAISLLSTLTISVFIFIAYLSVSTVAILPTITSYTHATISTSTVPPSSPFSPFQDSLQMKPPISPLSMSVPILTDLGYHELAMAAHSLAATSPAAAAAAAWPGPVTVFAPSDSAVRTCPSCSPSLLLQEHTVPGLYSLEYLKKLIFGSKIETILPGRCLTVTAAANGSKIFIGGAEITRPDIFNNGHLIIHGLQGFISHLSPYSCAIDKMTSLSLPHPSPALGFMRLMLADAMVRLRTSGYSVLALALRIKSPELLDLHNMTIFALDDSSIFHGGQAYVRDIRFHIVPNRLLMMRDLEKLPAFTVLPTLEAGESLTVTTSTSSGGGGFLAMATMRINYVKMKIPDLIHNPKIVVHGLALPFPHLHHSVTQANAAVNTGSRSAGSRMTDAGSRMTDAGSGENEAGSGESDSGSQVFGGEGMSSSTVTTDDDEVVSVSSPSPAVVESSSFEMEDRHGL